MLLKECVNVLTTDDIFRKAKKDRATKIYLNIISGCLMYLVMIF